ncbi:MAG: hypothetical protein V3V08_07245 [Nannocystaceae bacterium]
MRRRDAAELRQEALDNLVIDTALASASAVNNGGADYQRKWLLEHGWDAKKLDIIIEEMMEPEK